MLDAPILESNTKSNVFSYEKAWDVRRQILLKIIEEGEKNPLRVIKHLENFERFNSLNALDEDSYSYFPKTEFKAPVQNVVYNSQDRNQLNTKDFSFFPSGLNLSNTIAFDRTYVNIPSYYLKSESTLLLDLFKDIKVDAVVELGCGYGRNLIELFYFGGPKVPYYAGEFTKSGQNCVKLISQLCKEFELISFDHNHLKPDLSFLKKHKKVFVYTTHTIEQVEYIPLKLMEEIANCAEEVLCAHVEPFGFQMRDNPELSQVDKDHKNYFDMKGWNKNFLPILLEAHHKNILDICYIGKNIMGGDLGCPSSIAVWKNKNWKN